MAVTKEIKKQALEKAKDIFENSKSAVFVHFSKLDGNNEKEMRTAMYKEGVKYSVIKKTLIKKAASESSVKGEIPSLEGEIGLAYSFEDLTLPGRLVKEFNKKIEKKIQIMGGVFDGEFKNQKEMIEIANIPSLDILRGMFVNVINSPIQKIAIVLDQIANKKAI